MNLYAYCANNPVYYVDPSRHRVCDSEVKRISYRIDKNKLNEYDQNKIIRHINEKNEQNIPLNEYKQKISTALGIDNKNCQTTKHPNSYSKMQKQVEKGQAPREVDRVDSAHQNGQQSHVHFKDGTSLNQDGSVHDAHKGIPELSKKVSKWLIDNGWEGQVRK